MTTKPTLLMLGLLGVASTLVGAEQIKPLTTDSVERVSQGVGQADQAGATMAEIVGAVGQVSHLVSEISSATREQKLGIGEVSSAAAQLDQSTQGHATLVEETTAVSASLNQQAGRLARQVSTFKT